MLVISVALVLFLAFLYWYVRPKKFPGGPRGLPFVGILPWIVGKNIGDVFREYQKPYGRVFSVRLWSKEYVILNKFEDIHEALVRNGSIFSGRPRYEFYDVYTKGKGLAFMDYGHFWKVQRKFGMNTLRRIVVGKRKMEERINDEARHLLKEIRKKDSEPFDPRFVVTMAVSNITCSIAFGNRFQYDDETFMKLVDDLIQSSFGELSDALEIIELAYWTRHLPYLRQKYKKFLKNEEFTLDTIVKLIKNHQLTYDPNYTRDFIDAFIKEMNTGSDPSFELEQLAHYIRELFQAGSETTSSTMLWCILCFMKYPEHQEKLHNEVENVLGSARPSMADLQKMPYTAAFIEEILRHRTITPLTLPHKTTETVQFRGNVIPKNTAVFPNIWAVHFDSEFFENPKEFNPSRFIDQDGNFVKNPHVIPFAMGHRQCLGMQIAKMEVFIFLTTIVHQFQIVSLKEEKTPPFHDGYVGFTYTSNPYKTIFKPR